MAESNTTRFGLRRWTAGTDTPSRTEFDTGNANLEAYAAGFTKGVFASRPAAGAAFDRWFYLATDQTSTAKPLGTLYYCDGTGWAEVDAGDHGNLSGLGDDDHTQYVLGTSGLLSARPAASARARSFYYATDEDRLYYSNGTTWQIARMEGDVTVRHAWNYTLPGEIKIGASATDFLPWALIAVPSGQSVTLVGYKWYVGWTNGDSYTFKIEHYRPTWTTTVLVSGVVAAMSGTSSATGGGTFGTPKSCNDGDLWAPVITAKSGTPSGGSVAILADVTV